MLDAQAETDAMLAVAADVGIQASPRGRGWSQRAVHGSHVGPCGSTSNGRVDDPAPSHADETIDSTLPLLHTHTHTSRHMYIYFLMSGELQYCVMCMEAEGQEETGT